MGGRAALVLALSTWSFLACATPYQPKDSNGGYTDYEAQPGVIHVYFEGNGFTSSQVVYHYWHRRAFELCPGGYDMLSIADVGRTVVSSSGHHGGHHGGDHGGYQGEHGVTSARRPAMEGYIECVEE